MVLTHLVLLSFLNGASIAASVPEPEPEAPSAPTAAGGGGIDISNLMHIAKVLDQARKRKRRKLRRFLLS